MHSYMLRGVGLVIGLASASPAMAGGATAAYAERKARLVELRDVVRVAAADRRAARANCVALRGGPRGECAAAANAQARRAIAERPR